jgi:hypothetical protein
MSRLMLLVPFLLIGCGGGPPKEADVKVKLQELTRQHFDLTAVGDLKAVDLYHPAAFQKASREHFKEALTQAGKEMKDAGTKFELQLKEADVQFTKDRIFGVVPYKLTVLVFGNKSVTDGYILWISEDQGRSWGMIPEGLLKEPAVRKAMPELPRDLKLPEIKDSRSGGSGQG